MVRYNSGWSRSHQIMRRTRRKSDVSATSSVKLRAAKKTPEPPGVNRRASMPSLPLDKVGMLIMEANEITQYLQKDYVSVLLFVFSLHI